MAEATRNGGAGQKVLLIGYGNPGRLDDGLGPALAEAIGARDLPGLTADAEYQLSVEDAAAVAACDAVIFADASVSAKEPFEFRRVEPAPEAAFTTHSIEAGAVLGMARRMFGARTRGYALAIRGYAFDDFGERISGKARRNLEAALSFVEGIVRHGLLEEAAGAPKEPPAVGRRAGGQATTGNVP